MIGLKAFGGWISWGRIQAAIISPPAPLLILFNCQLSTVNDERRHSYSTVIPLSSKLFVSATCRSAIQSLLCLLSACLRPHLPVCLSIHLCLTVFLVCLSARLAACLLINLCVRLHICLPVYLRAVAQWSLALERLKSAIEPRSLASHVESESKCLCWACLF